MKSCGSLLEVQSYLQGGVFRSKFCCLLMVVKGFIFLLNFLTQTTLYITLFLGFECHGDFKKSIHYRVILS